MVSVHLVRSCEVYRISANVENDMSLSQTPLQELQKQHMTVNNTWLINNIGTTALYSQTHLVAKS